MSFDYCTLSDIQAELLGLDISDLPPTLISRINNDYIPMVKADVDSYCAENFDLTRVREFYDGNNLPTLALRHKPIHQIDVVTLRIVPSIQWFQFSRWFYIKNTSHTGEVVSVSGGVSPIVPGFLPTFDNPYSYPIGSGLTPEVSLGNTSSFSDSTSTYEGSDLHVDSVNGQLIIPPRVLFIESQGVPFWNYSWLMGQRNIEVGYYYGYTDVDHLPRAIRHASAKLGAAKILQMKGMWNSAGARSISQDNVTKNFGEGAYSAEIKMLKDEAHSLLNRYKRITV